MPSTDYSKLGKSELIRLLQRRDAERRLGLMWERNDIEREAALNDDFVALDLVPELCEGAAPYRNALVEGDNLDALRNLAVPLAGAVKCIYIDPPYNTGNKDFIYNDRYTKAEDRYRHSTWLEFIYRRLAVAKTLLAPNGVIFASIGEDEQARLSLIMEEVFGPAAKVGTFVWRRRGGANDEKKWFVSADHEYVHCFANPGFFFRGEKKDFSRYANPDNDSRGEWIRSGMTVNKSFAERPNTFYPIHDKQADVWYPPNPDRVWGFAHEENGNGNGNGKKNRRESINELISSGLVLFPEDPDCVVYRSVSELEEAIRVNEAPKNLLIYQMMDDIRREARNGEIPKAALNNIKPLAFWVGKKISRKMPEYKLFRSALKREDKPTSTWISGLSSKPGELEGIDPDSVTVLRSGGTLEGTKLISAMLGKRAFNFPKPLSLVKALVKCATSPCAGDVVLDFFAGSGTTGHAVMDLNGDDNGNRRFILVSSAESTEKTPEKNLCRDVAAKRLKLAIGGYDWVTRRGKKTAAPLKGDFAYFRTARIKPVCVRDEILHSQVWISLQMMHFPDVVPWEEGAKWARHESKAERIVYLAEFDSATAKKALKHARGENCTVYSWQPAMIQDAARSGAKVRRIPEYIMRRYGMENL